jgi:hypothetical protein
VVLLLEVAMGSRFVVSRFVVGSVARLSDS